jgi:hypothetical protein
MPPSRPRATDSAYQEVHMALVDRDVGVAVAATATVLSPRAREVVRKGAVYGLAGVLKAGDVAYSTVRGAARGAQDGVTGPDGNRSSRSSGGRSSGSRSTRSSRSGKRSSGRAKAGSSS